MRPIMVGRLAVASGQRVDGQGAQRRRPDRPQSRRSRQTRVKKACSSTGKAGALNQWTAANLGRTIAPCTSKQAEITEISVDRGEPFHHIWPSVLIGSPNDRADVFLKSRCQTADR